MRNEAMCNALLKCVAHEGKETCAKSAGMRKGRRWGGAFGARKGHGGGCMPGADGVMWLVREVLAQLSIYCVPFSGCAGMDDV